MEQQTKPHKDGIQSVDRALDIVEFLSKRPQPASVLEISAAVGIQRTTIYALLNTLVKRDYICKSDIDGKYTVTGKLYTLSSSYPSRLPVVHYATPLMQKLSHKYDMTTRLGVYLRDLQKILLVNSIYPGDNLVSGMLIPVHATGMGKTWMAFMPKDDREELLRTMELRRFTANTITEPELLRQQLAEIQTDGYGVDEGEYMEGTCCVAFPIFDDKNKLVAVMSISQREEKINPQREQIITDGLRFSKQCSMEMGWQM